MLWEKVGMDVVRMPSKGGKNYIVLARDGFSGWVEGQARASNIESSSKVSLGGCYLQTRDFREVGS